MQTGDLREKVTLLTLQKDGDVWTYQDSKTVYAAANVSDRGTILSGMGMGARAAEMTFRAANAPGLMQALKWRGDVYIVSTVVPDLKLWTTVTAAKIELRTTKVKGGITFPGIVLEKYVRWATGKPMDTTSESYLLVTPKAIELEEADVLSIDGLGTYHVTAIHRADSAKNEYEVERSVDL